MKKNPVRVVLMIILSVVFLYSAGWLIIRQFQYAQNGSVTESAKELAGLADRSEPSSIPSFSFNISSQMAELSAEPTLEPVPEELKDLGEIDLTSLQAVNPDVIGWIDIPGTDLSYPLLKGEDNQFYLERSWNLEDNACGSIFLECMNSPDFSDYHTIIYGHRMNNDSMFGMLRFYQDDSYRKEHPSIYIVCGNELRQYDVFAAYEADVEGIVYQLNLETKHREEEFIEACVENSLIDTGLKPTTQDQILTLSTCPSIGYASRLVVQGYLVKIYGR